MGANKSVLLDNVSVVGPSLSVAQHAHSSMDIDRPTEQRFTSIASTDNSGATPAGPSSFRATVTSSASNGTAQAATPIYKDGNLMQPAPTLGQALITLGLPLPVAGPVASTTAPTAAVAGLDAGCSNQGGAGSAEALLSCLRNAGETSAYLGLCCAPEMYVWCMQASPVVWRLLPAGKCAAAVHC